MRTARKLATAGAAAFVLLGTLGVAAGPAGADTVDGAVDPTATEQVPTEQTAVDPAPADPAPAVGPQDAIDVPLLPVTATYPQLVEDQDPLITGTVKYGQPLHVSTGTWTGAPTITYTYQWQHCDDDPCTDIAGATSADYTPVVADIDHRLGATVTATNTFGTRSAGSDWTDEVEGILPTGPRPTVSGIARVGETLTATVGPWTGPTDLTTTWRWGRCEGLYACSGIDGANSPTYVITAEDLGAILVARVDVSGPLGSDGAPSEPTAVVLAAPAAGDSNVTTDGNTITVSGSGFAPDSDVTVVLHSDPVVLGVAHTDAAGNFTATFAIPAGTPAGDHHLVFTGVDAYGNPITVEQAITLGGTTPVAGPRTAGAATLPVTGDDALSLALAGAGLFLAGALALWASRRQTAPVT
jgi:LPXTG-motif cell wall-anchored protein